MGKSKKKKRNDARGYGGGGGGKSRQGQSPFSQLAAGSNDVLLNKQTHEGIQSLVNQLRSSGNEKTHQKSNDNNGTAKDIVASDSNVPLAYQTNQSTIRFVPKFTKIFDRLIELGFQYDCGGDELDKNSLHLENMVVALGYGITLESALDWLCLNVPTLDLPPLFTDGNLRDSLMQEKRKGNSISNDSEYEISSPLTVLKFVSSSAALESQSTSEDTKQEEKGEEKELFKQQQQEQQERMKKIQKNKLLAKQKAEQEEREAAKKRLLEQYAQYHSDSDDDKGTDGSDIDSKESQSNLSPQEVELVSKERELNELEADLGCDANNYMRSKQEMKLLRNQTKKLKQQVAGLRRKVENQKRQREKKLREIKEKADQPEEQEEEENAGLFLGGGGLFDNEEEDNEEEIDETTDIATTDNDSGRKESMDCPIPKGWTGATPRKVLEDTCRKQRLGRPKFLNMGGGPAGGYKLLGINVEKRKKTKSANASTSQNLSIKDEWIALSSDFSDGSSLPDYLALKALYQIDSNKPLYGMFPPAFRSLWLSWLKEAQDNDDEIKQAFEIKRNAHVQKLLEIIDANHRAEAMTSPTNLNSNGKKVLLLGEQNGASENENKTTDEVEESWEDIEDVESQSTKLDTKFPSKAGASLKREFLKRQSMSSYTEMLKQRETLPMASYRSEVLETIKNNQVMILCAETGAGKTTQFPQYLLEEALLNGSGDAINIICTQPRRVAATSVAERVAAEMNERLGNQVGYQIRMEAKRSKKTKLLFCTTGVILRRLQDDHNLKSVTHVIVDEVHERQVQTDVLLISLRQLLRTTRRDLKVILMSATLDSNLFSDFFNHAPVIKVPGRTFPVANYFLEDLLDATGHIIEEGSRYAFREYRQSEKTTLWVTSQGGEKHREVVDLAQRDTEVSDLYSGYAMSTRLSLERVDESLLNYDLIQDVLHILLIQPERNSTLIAPDGADTSNGSILIFLPGIGEIRALTDRLSANRFLSNKSKFNIIPLHSKLSSADQRKAFLPMKNGCRKIILSTNIAETSVTIQDVVIVIDCGRERELRRNKRTSTSVLVIDWCSKANTKQRAGRAGRVQPGLCLKLYSSNKADSLKKASEPELKRVPLEEVCLSILASGMGKDCGDFLRQAPQPPPDEAVEEALNVLEEVGAITSERNLLTPLGLHLAKLPVDVRLGKMLILGSLFHCLDKVLTIAASLSSKSPFSTSMHDAATAKAKHKQFEDTDSDFATLCNVWEGYNYARSKSIKAGRSYCQANYLNQAAMHDIASAKKDFLSLLSGLGFVNKDGPSSHASSSNSCEEIDVNLNSNNWTLVHAVVFAGLNPNVARLKESKPGSYTLWSRNQQIHFHRASVNASKKRFSNNQNWLVFFEKFGTPHRTSVTTTCFVGSMPIILFGGSLLVKHMDRIVVVNEWMEIEMAAQIGVMLKELRREVENLLLKLIVTSDKDGGAKPRASLERESVIKSIVDILSHTSLR